MINHLKGKKVMIVDDEPGFREVLVDEFHILSGITVAVDDVETALKRLEQDVFDLIISDCSMPGQSGVMLLGKVREFRTRRIPFILMTGFANRETKVALEIGADAVFMKPFDMEALLAKANELLDPSRTSTSKENS